MASPFSPLPPIAHDPIFDLMAAARAAGPSAIDATVGMILDEEGAPVSFVCISEALRAWAKETRDLGYPPLLGFPEFRTVVTRLIAGSDDPLVASCAATGGTGAVALNLRLIRTMHPEVTVLLPVPTWVNHRHLCVSAGMTVRDVPYLEGGSASISGIIDAVRSAKEQTCALLQGFCHNPTGLDLSEAHWRELAAVLSKHGTVVLLDLPYQGFGVGIEEDALPVRVLREAGVPLLVAWSGSKNCAAYGLRIGLACAFAGSSDEKQRVDDHYAMITRGLHSAASVVGQAVVGRVLTHDRARWEAELAAIRTTIDCKRRLLAQALPPSCAPALAGHGMFALLPLSTSQVEQLRTEYRVFLTNDGRVNIAGIPKRRIGELAQAVRSVL